MAAVAGSQKAPPLSPEIGRRRQGEEETPWLWTPSKSMARRRAGEEFSARTIGSPASGDRVRRTPGLEALDVVDHLSPARLHGLLAGPADVRSDDDVGTAHDGGEQVVARGRL